MLPVMSGIDAAAAIRAFAPNVNIILMSGSGHGTLFQHGITKSHFTFMEKPFTLAHLCSLLSQALLEKELGA
jgi:DNA-binding NtrC family response regulator